MALSAFVTRLFRLPDTIRCHVETCSCPLLAFLVGLGIRRFTVQNQSLTYFTLQQGINSEPYCQDGVWCPEGVSVLVAAWLAEFVCVCVSVCSILAVRADLCKLTHLTCGLWQSQKF